MIAELIPGEIWDHIIDCAMQNDDKRFSDLKALCLVQKSFVSRSRCHLFRTLHLHHDGSGPKFLLRTLETSPELRTYVSALALEDGYFLPEEADPRWLRNSETLPALAKYFPHVKRLVLRNVRLDDLDDAARTSLLEGFQEVTHLDFDCDTSCFGELVTNFPEVKSLRHYWPIKCGTVPPPDTLETVISDDWKRIGPWLLMRRPVPPIRSITFMDLYERDCPAVSDVIDMFGRQIQALHVHILDSNAFYASAFSTVFSGRFRALRLLVIDDMIRLRDQSHCGWICTFLSSIELDVIQCINFRIWINMCPEFYWMDWNRLDELLGRDDWKESLTKVLFDLPKDIPDRNYVAQWIRGRLPRIARRKIIEFAALPVKHTFFD